MYNRVVTSVRTSGGIIRHHKFTSEFPITIYLHQGMIVSTYIFALVMDELTNLMQDEIL